MEAVLVLGLIVLFALVLGLHRRRRAAGAVEQRSRLIENVAELEVELALTKAQLSEMRDEARASDEEKAGTSTLTALGVERHISRTSGRPYYRNDIPPPLPNYPALARDDGFYRYEIHGESHHTAAIQAAVGGPFDAPVYYRTNALIMPEPTNAFDANAVAVYLGDQIVGYVPRNDAQRFGAELHTFVGPGAVQCRAEVSGGFARAGEPVTYWIHLDIKRPLRLVR